jgi:hypothetical protein
LPDGVPADVIQETIGMARDTAVATVNGREITAEELLYWVAYSADQVMQMNPVLRRRRHQLGPGAGGGAHPGLRP